MADTILNPVSASDRLRRNWTIIGRVLLAASVAHPVAASFLSNVPPSEFLAPMTMMTGGDPLPAEVEALFAGVFANIRFSLAFAALKLVVGGLILAAALGLTQSKDWRRAVLRGASYAGIAAFIGIGLYFAYSSFVIGTAMDVPLLLSLMTITFGAAVAYFPARWLWRQNRSLQAL